MTTRFLRKNVGDGSNTPATVLTEKDARNFLAASMKNVDRAIKILESGKEIRTRFAIYSAEKSNE